MIDVFDSPRLSLGVEKGHYKRLIYRSNRTNFTSTEEVKLNHSLMSI